MALSETKSRWDVEAPRLENVFGYNVTSVLWIKKLSPHSYIFHIHKDWYPQGQLTWILFKKPCLWWLHTSTCYRTTWAWTPWLILFGTCFSVVFVWINTLFTQRTIVTMQPNIFKLWCSIISRISLHTVTYSIWIGILCDETVKKPGQSSSWGVPKWQMRLNEKSPPPECSPLCSQ